MGVLINNMVSTFDAYDLQYTASSSSRSGTAPFSPTTVVPSKSKRRDHRKGNSSTTSVMFTGESHWGPESKTPKLVSLEVASRTPSITKRGFEWTYHKSHGHRLTGGSLYFGPVSSLVRKPQRDTAPRGITPCPDPDVPPLLPAASIASGPREKHGSTVTFDICDDSTKKLLKAAPLISLEEAKQREVSRRKRAAKIQVEHEVRGLKREVAEIARKKEQAKREEERLAQLKKERQGELEALEGRKREDGSTLTAAVAARKDELVVAPTTWIVPLISLDEARNVEKAKRDAVDKYTQAPPRSSPSPSAVASIDSLMINTGNGNTATLQLVSLEDAAKRDRARRLEEGATDAIRSRTRMLARAGTGLSHVPLITLAEAHKQDTLRRENGSSQDGAKSKSPNLMSRSRKPSRSSHSPAVNYRAIETDNGDRRALLKDAAGAQEKARWIALMSNTGNWWTRPDTASSYFDSGTVRAPKGISDWV